MSDYNRNVRSVTSHSGRTWIEEWEWIKWPIAAILFSMNLWPVAVFVLIFFPEYRKKQIAKRKQEAQRAAQQEAHRTAAQEAMDRRRGVDTRVQYTAPASASTSEGKQNAAKPAAAAPKAARQKDSKRTRLLRIIGIAALVIGVIVSMDALPSLIEGYTFALEDLITGIGFMTGGGIVWGRAEYQAKLSRRTKRYILAIGAAETMRLDEIAKRVNRPVDKTRKELQKLIDKGYLGEDAYIDYEKGYFARFGATVEEKQEAPVPKEANEGYSGILRELRAANDRIADEHLSGKIERLEQISALIFKEVEAHPEKRERIRTFFDYYLPTTQKLLDTYAEFDELGVEGENLRETKERIEAMMDSIVEGFEHQLDRLYSADAMEVASDIKVMETMLGREISSAAKDFGYDRKETPKEQDEQQMQQLEL